jgi:hypothetical protein
MNAVVELKPQALVPDRGRMAVADVVQQAMAIQEVMRAVMKENVHYGVIPGTDKPTLYKAGAEKLCLTFHIADRYVVEDLSNSADAIRYRVTCIGTHQQTGVEMGQGIGEAQTGEEKYRWRKAVCKEEFEATPVALRRTKYGKKSGGFYTVDQVRTEPADMANTVLKMAAKRAKMAMVLNVLAASDAFTQDLEDLSDELREHLTADERDTARELMRAACVAKVNATTTPEALKAVSKECVPLFQKARDTEGYALFAQAVKAHGATFGAKTAVDVAAARAAEATRDPFTAGPHTAAPSDDPFVAEMNAAEGAKQ